MQPIGKNADDAEVMVGEHRQHEGGDTDDRRHRKGQRMRGAETEEKRQGGLSQEQKKEVKRLEKKIQQLEEKKAEISAHFHDTSLSPERITELSKELGALNEEIEELEMRWLELAEQA